MRKKIFAIGIIIAIFTLAMITTEVSTIDPTISLQPVEIAYGVNPVKAECFNNYHWWEIPEETVPFNVDMIDAEHLWNDGEGIYVAVLDTGLLSNYLDIFPEDKVDIKEEWGKGFTHDLIWAGSGGNWSEEFDYGALRDDRGFITHDDFTPDKYGFGWGSGHGTHVSSIITGWQLNRDDAQFWVRGVAPKITLIPVLVLDDWIEFNPDFSEGWFFSGGTWEMVAAGIRYIGDLAKEHRVKIVINMSLGGPSSSELIEDAIDYAIRQGVIVVASAGNEGYDGMGWPGAYPQVVSVAAGGWTQEYLRYYTGADDPWYWWTDNVPERLWTEDVLGNDFQVYLTDFSSRPNPDLGQKRWHLDVTAPGAAVRGPHKPYGPTQWNYYAVWGTSQAAPHIAGTAALVLQRYPKMTQFEMQRVLKIAGHFVPLTKWPERERTAIIFDIFSGGLLDQTWYWNEYGTGLVQADNALFVARWFD
jgi:subtilisin family serine protease